MIAHFTQKGVRRQLLMLVPEQMDKLLGHPKHGLVTGIPAYFDMHKRLWPKAAAGIEVTFESEAPGAPEAA